MKKTNILAVLLLCAALGLYACARKISDDDKMLAKVSNKTITLKDFKSKMAKIPSYYQNVVENNKKRYLDELIMEMLMYEEAVRRGIDRTKEIKDIVNEAKKKVVIAKLVKDEVEDKAVVTEDEIKKYYEAHRDEFKTPELWRASHILVASEKEARDVLDELAKGARFEDLAKARSTDATAVRGGDVGYFRAGQVVPDFEKACMKLNVGQTSDIVKTQFGYHIIKLTDKKEAGLQSYDEARRSIESELKRKKRSELFNNLVLKLKEKYHVEIDEALFNGMEKASKSVENGPKQ